MYSKNNIYRLYGDEFAHQAILIHTAGGDVTLNTAQQLENWMEENLFPLGPTPVQFFIVDNPEAMQRLQNAGSWAWQKAQDIANGIGSGITAGFDFIKWMPWITGGVLLAAAYFYFGKK